MTSFVPRYKKILALTKGEIRMSEIVASAFAPQFIVPVAAALLSHPPRSWQRPNSDQAKYEAALFLWILRNGPAAEIENYSVVTNIMTDVLHQSRHREIDQLILLLRLLNKQNNERNVLNNQEPENADVPVGRQLRSWLKTLMREQGIRRKIKGSIGG